jgi:hypothetical protein
MPELNPRRRFPTLTGRIAQVAAAVLAGMGAMFCLENVAEFRREAARVAIQETRAPAPAPASEPVPAPPEPETGPDLSLPQGVRRQAGPVPSSMMLKPEPGLSGVGATVVSVSGEEVPHHFEMPAPPPAPPEEPAAKKAMPRLQDRSMASPFASAAVRNEGRFAAIKRRATPQAVAAAKAAPAPPAPEPKPLAGASAIKMIETAAAPSENLQPALLAQLTTPEVVFWTKQRKINVGIALALTVLGIIYLIYASGIRDAPPERGEGEF